MMFEPDDDPLAAIRQHIIDTRPELAHDASLPDRLERAYAHAVVLGFTDGDAIHRFLRYEATAPNFYPAGVWSISAASTVPFFSARKMNRLPMPAPGSSTSARRPTSCSRCTRSSKRCHRYRG
jgi:hypothetical protein